MTKRVKPPSIPSVLVELGRAIELDSDTWTWTWNQRDNWSVTASSDGKRIFLFKRPPQKNKVASPKNRYIKRGERFYRVFNRRKADEVFKGSVHELKKRVGRAIHVVYESNKFGPKRQYIHTFDAQPIVWVDKENLPKIVALTGGDIRITKRGIEG